MDNIEYEYKSILKEENKLKNIENELIKNDMVAKYINLKNKEKSLSNRKYEIYKKMKFNEYSLCDHIFIPIYKTHDNKHNYYGCIKCKLNNLVSILSTSKLDDEIMKEFLKEIDYMSYINFFKYIDIYSPIDLAHSIYNELKVLSLNNYEFNNIFKEKVNDKLLKKKIKK